MNGMLKYIILSTMTFCIAACGLDPQGDDYAPNAQVEGALIVTGTGDSNYDGKPMLFPEGSIRFREDSWTDDPDKSNLPWQSWGFRSDIDGISFRDTKIWAGDYTLYPFEGSFYPLTEESWTQVALGRGANKINFEVTPYLIVEWVKEPHFIPSPFENAKPGDQVIQLSLKFRIIDPPTNTSLVDADGNPKKVEFRTEHRASFGVSKNKWMTAATGGNYGPDNPNDTYKSRSMVNAEMEGEEITLTFAEPLKYPGTGMVYYIRGAVSVGNPTKTCYTTVIPVPLP
jgi:hypothetical protein